MGRVKDLSISSPRWKAEDLARAGVLMCSRATVYTGKYLEIKVLALVEVVQLSSLR